MSEKLYKIVSGVGAGSIALGIITLVTGVYSHDRERCQTSEGQIRYDDLRGFFLKKETKTLIRRMGILLFVIYIIFLVYFLFFSEEYGRAAEAQRVYRYNLIPFVEIRRFWIYREQLGTFAVFSNIFGNVIGFLPFGFILPVIFRRMNSGFLICVSGFILSLTVEVIQLVTKVGCFDVDDMILNTLGATLGYVLFFVCNHIVTVHW